MRKLSPAKLKEIKNMKKTFSKIIILCLVFFMMASVNGNAQEVRTGTNAASELLIPVGARYIAMGGAPVATVTGVDAIYWNPAGLSQSNYTADVMFSRMTHIAGIDINYAALRLEFGGLGTVGFSLKALDIGNIAVTTEFDPDGTGAILNPQFVTAGLSYAKTLTDRISVGATVNIISETLERVNATGVAFDFGVQYHGLANVEGLSVGVVVKNLGPSIGFSGSGLLRDSRVSNVDRGSSPLQIQTQKDELPSYIGLGLSYDLKLNDKSSVIISTSFQDNNFSDDSGLFGGEYNYDNLFYVRAGYSVVPDAATDVNIYGFTAGGGIHYDFKNLGITVDYAYRNVDFFDASNVFTIALGF